MTSGVIIGERGARRKERRYTQKGETEGEIKGKENERKMIYKEDTILESALYMLCVCTPLTTDYVKGKSRFDFILSITPVNRIDSQCLLFVNIIPVTVAS